MSNKYDVYSMGSQCPIFPFACLIFVSQANRDDLADLGDFTDGENLDAFAEPTKDQSGILKHLKNCCLLRT